MDRSSEFWRGFKEKVRQMTQAEPFIAKALERQETHNLDDVMSMILAGEAFLLSNEKAAAVLRVDHYPRTRHLSIWLCGGDKDTIIGWYDHAVKIAREQGCTRLVQAGRKGWLRVMPDWAEMTSDQLILGHRSEKSLSEATEGFPANQAEIEHG